MRTRKFPNFAPVAQWIEQWFPEPCLRGFESLQVRFFKDVNG